MIVYVFRRIYEEKSNILKLFQRWKVELSQSITFKIFSLMTIFLVLVVVVEGLDAVSILT